MKLETIREKSILEFQEMIHFEEYPYKEDIEKDLNRTFPDNIFFKKKVAQEFLRNILKCISLSYPHMGYCQGLNYVCAFLGNYFTDEMTFYSFLYLFAECDL